MDAIRRLLVVAALVAPLPALAQPAPAGRAEATQQPGLVALVQPRIAQIRDAGITQIVGRTGARNNIQVLTRSGPAYMRWPRGVTPRAFELYFNSDGSNAAFASDFSDQDRAAWSALLDAVIPQALKDAAQLRANATRPKP